MSYATAEQATQQHIAELAFAINLNHVRAGDKRFPGVVIYTMPNKNATMHWAHAEFVPHTNVQYRTVAVGIVLFESEHPAVCLRWLARHTLEQLRLAIATMQMLGHDNIGMCRSFEKRNHL